MLLTKKNMKAIRAEQEEKHREATRSLRKLRVEQMYEQRASGMSFQEIATNFGVTGRYSLSSLN
jgi:DNA invertase Pin-like site-specific DNA recombinase